MCDPAIHGGVALFGGMTVSKYNKHEIIDGEFEDVIEEPVLEAVEATEPVAEAAEPEREVLCGVVLKRCPVVSYNPYSKVLVYSRDGQLIQTNAVDYHGEGYVEVE